MTRLARSPLARIRLAAGFDTAREAAEKLGITRIWLLEIEEGRGRPSEDLVGRMAQLYHKPQESVRRASNSVRRELLSRQHAQLRGA